MRRVGAPPTAPKSPVDPSMMSESSCAMPSRNAVAQCRRAMPSRNAVAIGVPAAAGIKALSCVLRMVVGHVLRIAAGEVVPELLAVDRWFVVAAHVVHARMRFLSASHES